MYAITLCPQYVSSRHADETLVRLQSSLILPATVFVKPRACHQSMSGLADRLCGPFLLLKQVDAHDCDMRERYVTQSEHGMPCSSLIMTAAIYDLAKCSCTGEH